MLEGYMMLELLIECSPEKIHFHFPIATMALLDTKLLFSLAGSGVDRKQLEKEDTHWCYSPHLLSSDNFREGVWLFWNKYQELLGLGGS
jgi:hypothetical protein